MNLTTEISYLSPDAEGISSSCDFINRTIGFLKTERGSDEITISLLENAYNLLQFSKDDESQNLGLSVICHVADNLSVDPMVRILLADCITACSNFLYRDMLVNRYGAEWCLHEPSFIDDFKREFYRANDDTILTKQQRQLLSVFRKNPRLVVSAPTSFGKTRLLQEIILERKYQRVALVMPTIALIAETVRRLRNDNRFAGYAILNTASLPLGTSKYIFVLTPEKLDLLLGINKEINFEFFAMDEIYKVQEDDGRRAVFASVLYQMATSGAEFYLIGPYFKSFSERFLQKTRALFKHYSLEIVQKDEIKINALSAGDSFEVDGVEVVKAKTDKTNLKRIVKNLKDQQLIYNSTKRGTETVARMLAEESEISVGSPLIEYIKENISKEWSLVKCLESGVGFHHGSMPRYIQSELVDHFNRGEIRSLVCTTTLTEGVNTTAKNVILYSNMKGDDSLSGFDYKNIKGRAGRFLHHFVGRIITFYPVKEEEKDIVTFHYLDDEDLDSDEVLFIDQDDLQPKAKVKRDLVLGLLNERKVPINVIKQNKYITVEKQLILIERLRKDRVLLNSLIFHSNIPDKVTFERILDLTQEILFSKTDYEDKGNNIPLSAAGM
jgi:hypothetical protein